MAFEPTESETEKILMQYILPFGLSGNVEDFCGWIKMEVARHHSSIQDFSPDFIKPILNRMMEKGLVSIGKFDPSEFCISDSAYKARQWVSDSYEILGTADYSPIQYVRSRLEFFLEKNLVDEEDRLDISIATVEAIENAVKYGDGTGVKISCSIDSEKMFKISIINNIKEFDLGKEIERGKYSSNTTLMRGIMVMQKLFNNLDLRIADNHKRAELFAEKKLK